MSRKETTVSNRAVILVMKLCMMMFMRSDDDGAICPQESGLSSDISDAFGEIGDIPLWVLVMVLCVITAGFTEITSNVATATIFLPILAELVSIYWNKYDLNLL